MHKFFCREQVLKLTDPNRNITEGRLVFIITHHYLAPPPPSATSQGAATLVQYPICHRGSRMGEDGGEADSAVGLFPPLQGAPAHLSQRWPAPSEWGIFTRQATL